MKWAKSSFFIFVLFFSCQLTPIEPKEAQFTRPQDSIINEFLHLNSFERVNINWTIRQFGKDTSSNLKLLFYNGKNLPIDDSSLREYGKSTMQILINSIKNESDYDKFIVYFIQDESKGITVYKRERKYEFRIEDFK
jgi:hypothetical protein